ncbi:hypothetical protein Y032_0200g1699 [Ancylostoma ceylanicum]|uniref:Dcp1-like decapping family protein n=1 Tax=Ancylostoma ceylanicum TaxID=53326 RepID=A0A016SNJ3_9BILA|nr:hypothetical protein Y032_0200g1699 [Ancylostoma ceylanicum]
MEQKPKADPNLTARNLCSIQRIDPCAVAILDKATHAAKYNFDVATKSWTKTNIEGALFIIQRADKPYYSLIIANRQSLDDMVEPVNPLTKMNLEGHYLFFCKPDIQRYMFNKLSHVKVRPYGAQDNENGQECELLERV